MRNRIIATLLALAAVSPTLLQAQLGGFGDIPVEITADGETRFEGGVAIAEDNVIINYGDTQIYCDQAQYNPETREVLLRGQVRIYRQGFSFLGERAVYNLETKALRAADFAGDAHPFKLAADNVTSLGGKGFKAMDGVFTTHDSARPDYRLRARSVRIYPDDRIIFSNVTLLVGKTPVFWWPYLYQSLREDMAFTITPGYSNRWGAYVQTLYTFPIGDNASGRFRLDLRSERGPGAGFDSDYTFGKDNRSFGKFQSYVANDSTPDKNETSLSRSETDSSRYRVALQQRAYLTEDIRADIDFNLLSDAYLLEDYFPGEFTVNPQPDTNIAVTKWDEDYTLTLLARMQVNDFQETTERLPELVLDVPRQPFFGTQLYYQGETGAAFLQKRFESDSALPDYDTTRFDTLHQLIYPRTYFGWLTFAPRIGVRATWYGDTGSIYDEVVLPTQSELSALANNDPQLRKQLQDELDNLALRSPEELAALATSNSSTIKPALKKRLRTSGSDTRAMVLAGFESSFKLTKVWDDVQSRSWGLDGLRHVFQPYTHLSFVSDPGLASSDLLQFDRLVPSTQVPPIGFPQFVSTDSIDEWTIWRFGVRNRLQTRRDLQTFNWLTLDTWVDANIDNPYDATDFSNVNARLDFRPLPWLGLNMDAQLPIFDDGFTEVNTGVRFMVSRNAEFRVGNRYLQDNAFFEDSNLLTVGGYYRVNENWGLSFQEQYEVDDGTLEYQRYMVHRDLTSWVASLGAIVRDNRGGKEEFGFLLTFTLKDFPEINIPLNLDPDAGSGRNN
jgi:LPS-assembly protein